MVIFNIETLLLYISSIWDFEVGDLIYTGTPEGVGEVKKNDILKISGDFISQESWEII
jgi:2-keto-4-pentenoate hydratase/2-oxohepta-3-ene-1,7-dioic acid hydratase in catechol pathway